METCGRQQFLSVENLSVLSIPRGSILEVYSETTLQGGKQNYLSISSSDGLDNSNGGLELELASINKLTL